MFLAAVSMLWRRWGRRILPLLLGLAWPLCAPAAQVTIEPKIGFGGVFQLGRPFPLEVCLHNIGRTVEGVVEVEAWKRGAPPAGAYPVRYQRDVFLPSRAQRTLAFTVNAELLSRPLVIRFNATHGSASHTLDLRSHFSPAPLVLSVSGGGTLPLTSLAASFTNRIVSLAAAGLPSDARALAGVSHLLLYDQSLRDLTRWQLQALDDWLVAGGRMIIVASLNFALYQEPKLARFVPARVTGVTRIRFTDPAAAGASPAIEGVWAHTVSGVSGRTQIAAEGLPLLVENEWGRGRVSYLALDAGRPPLAGWAGLPQFLQTLLAPASELSPAPRPRWDEALFSRLLLSSWFVDAYIPTRALFFAILLYLCGLAVLLLKWRRQRGAPRTLALWCCGWMVGCAAAGYGYFSRGGQMPEGVLLGATVMDETDGDYVEVQTNLALFSTRPRDYSLGFGPSWLELAPLPQPHAAAPAEQAAPAVMYRHLGAATRVQLPLESFGHQLLRARHVERAGLNTRIEQHDGVLHLEVNNRSGSDLTDCWLIAPGLRVALGELPSGGSLRKALPLHAADAPAAEQPRQADTGGSLRALRFKDKTRDLLFQDAFFAYAATAALWTGPTAVFIGWFKNPQPRAEVGDPRVRTEQYTLYRAIVSLPSEDE